MEVVQQIQDIIMKEFDTNKHKNMSVAVDIGSKSGDGFVAQILNVQITFEEDETKKSTSVIIKRAQKNNNRKYMSMQNTFQREILFYTHIKPKYLQLMDEYQIDLNLRCRFPICYGYSQDRLNEYIILENLKEEGFYMTDFKSPDYSHTVLAIQAIARMHGLSMVLEKTYPAAYNEIVNSLTPVFMVADDEASNEGFRNYGKNCLKMFMTSLHGCEDLKKRLLDAVGSEHNTVKAVADRMVTKGNINVISHGDLWLNNALFKLKDGVPAECVPIDFQLVIHCSIANDLLYFTGTNADTQLTKKFWEIVLAYHEHLKRFLAAFAFDVNDFCTLDQLRNEIKNQAFFAIVTSVIKLPLKHISQPTENESYFSANPPEYVFKPNEAYIKDVNDIIQSFIEIGLI